MSESKIETLSESVPQVLVIEDEQDVRELICLHLRRNGYQTLSFESGEEEASQSDLSLVSLAVLDWMLPGVSGLDLIKKFKGRFPILMVTARADTADIVMGLEAGADDYLVKPFEFPVLLARVRALFRRQELLKGVHLSSAETPLKIQNLNQPTAAHLAVGEVRVNPDSYQAFVENSEVPLTQSEFKLLCALLKNQGRVLTRDQLIELVQGEGVSVIDRSIDTHVFGLRKKLGHQAHVIETVRGVGYRVG